MIWRVVQVRPVKVTTLVVKGTLEEKALSLLDQELPPRKLIGLESDVQDQTILRHAAVAELELGGSHQG